MDSAAFTELLLHGEYRHSPDEYADLLHRLHTQGVADIECAVAQDYMCEPFMLAKTGKTIEEHQRLTIERYDALIAALREKFCGKIPFHVMPVIQGYAPEDYVRHVQMYGERLTAGMWVGVGSVCKRQGKLGFIENVLLAIKGARPDLRLHGFGVKLLAFMSQIVVRLLYSADSMAWSYAARKQGRNGNDWKEARRFAHRIKELCKPREYQPRLL